MIFNMVGGGGGSGATLVVSSPANVSVTVSKDDKSYTKNSGSLGSATFKGLATGTWTVVISGNGQTATKTIEITADYAITIAFFSATINITYPANSNCVVTNAGGQTVASDTNTTSSTKTWTAIVSATGTYTVTATATDSSGKSKSQSVEITSDGQSASVTLSYELILFDNGVVSGYAWDSSKSSYGGAKVSDGLINLWGTTWDNNISFQSGWGEIGISSAIGLSDYSALKVHLNKIDGANGTATIQVGTTALGDNTATKTVTLTAGTTTSLDISSITGSKYISLYAQSNTGAYGNHIGVSFDKVWLE